MIIVSTNCFITFRVNLSTTLINKILVQYQKNGVSSCTSLLALAIILISLKDWSKYGEVLKFYCVSLFLHLFY